VDAFATHLRYIGARHGSNAVDSVLDKAHYEIRNAIHGRDGETREQQPGPVRTGSPGQTEGAGGSVPQGGQAGSAERPGGDVSGSGGRSSEISETPERSNLDLFSPAEREQIEREARGLADKLLHDQLTAQLKSGGQVKPSNLKPAENRGLFEEHQPESGNLFGPERGSLSLKSTRTPEQVQAARDKQYGREHARVVHRQSRSLDRSRPPAFFAV
jgi:hypothetical protein